MVEPSEGDAAALQLSMAWVSSRLTESGSPSHRFPSHRRRPPPPPQLPQAKTLLPSLSTNQHTRLFLSLPFSVLLISAIPYVSTVSFLALLPDQRRYLSIDNPTLGSFHNRLSIHVFHIHRQRPWNTMQILQASGFCSVVSSGAMPCLN